MKSHRWHLLALLLALVLAVFAAGCGGDDDEDGDGGAPTGETTEDVSGDISMLGLWTGQERNSILAVIEGFNQQYPNVNVSYRGTADVRPPLATAIEGGNPPDIAAIPNPGLVQEFARRGALKPIDFARSTIAENYTESWLDLGTVEGKLYAVFFKGVNKSTVWYNVHVFEDAGIEPPEDWDGFLEAADTLKQFGTPAFALGGGEGWTLTDMFENIYLRTAGPEKYDQLVAHEIPWTDPSVKEALTELAKILGDPQNIAGGTNTALQDDLEQAVEKVFKQEPEAAMVIAGDFVPGVGTEATGAEAQTDFNFFTFPAINDSPEVVVGGGDALVMFNDNPAARAMIEYLATPEAAEIWVKLGGFSAPNKGVDPNAYPDEILRETATALAEAETFRFDLSDLLPSAFGGDQMFTILQDFVRNPDDVDGIAQRLERAHTAAE
jgi:alpha-glucoside transport system substrate-binding protein